MKNTIARTTTANNTVIEDFKSKEESASRSNVIWNSTSIKHDILQLVLLNEALQVCEVQITADRIEEISLGLRNRIEFKLLCQEHAFFSLEKDLHAEPADA